MTIVLAMVAGARVRNAEGTRADILAAARARFGRDGYERTTLRAIAVDVGVDAALVIRYFGNKQQLFATAAEFTIDLPDLRTVEPDRMADAMLDRFFAVWEADTTFVALLRAAMTSAEATETMRGVFATQVAPTIAAVVPDNPGPRAALIGSLVIGMATTRYVLEAPAAKAMSHEQVIAWAGPMIQNLLTGPAPA